MDSLGVVEVGSIASGVELADGMVKVASVELVRAATLCSGRFLIYVAGDREAVETSVGLARESGKRLTGSFVISHVSPQLIAALKRSEPAMPGEALGVVECRFVSPGIHAADKAVKRSEVRLLKFVSGQGIAGKSFFVLGGDVAAVREAVDAAGEVLGSRLLEAVVIPNPAESLARALTGAVR
ncbi:BMC domain-containing protein [Mailhella sp.]|uniref:BMC domain-containing protein n=1 Tax=Mailhella sp. TaxID=1981029 RepID=UPI003AB89D3E